MRFIKTIVEFINWHGVIPFLKSDFFDLLMYFTSQWSRCFLWLKHSNEGILHSQHQEEDDVDDDDEKMVIKADTKFHKSRLNVEIKHSIQTLG